MANSASDYLGMLLGLQPRGAAWTRRRGSNWARLWESGAEGFRLIEEALWRLAREANPLTTNAALPDWEFVTGLPDECTVPGESEEMRKAAVIAKLQRPGGQSIDFFLQFLGPFGDKVEIFEGYPPFLADFSVAYDRTWELASGAISDGAGGWYVDYYRGWMFVWTVKRTNHNSRRFRAGRNRAGQSLVEWLPNKEGADPNLECRINQLKPAHTEVMFEYAVDNEG